MGAGARVSRLESQWEVETRRPRGASFLGPSGGKCLDLVCIRYALCLPSQTQNTALPGCENQIGVKPVEDNQMCFIGPDISLAQGPSVLDL